jgi:hypothetical protein
MVADSQRRRVFHSGDTDDCSSARRSTANCGLDRSLWFHLWSAPDWTRISAPIVDNFPQFYVDRSAELIAPSNASSLNGLSKNAVAP